MNRTRITLALALAASALGHPTAAAAQAATPAEVLRGRTADVHLSGGDVTGELLALDGDTLWLGAADGLRGVAVADVRRIRVHRHGLDGGTVLTWTLVGAGLSTLGMTAACSRVEGTDCSAVAGVTLLSWGLWGGLFGTLLARSSREDVPASAAGLRPWVRYPGGLPPSRRPGARPRPTPSPPGGVRSPRVPRRRR